MNGSCNGPSKVNSTKKDIKMPDNSLHRVKKINATREDKMKLKKKRKLLSQSSVLEAQTKIPAINGDSEHLYISQKEIKSIKKKKNNHLLEKVILMG